MKLDMLFVPRVTIGELHTLTENVIKLCKPHQGLAVALTLVEQSFAGFVQAVSKNKASAVSKSEFDTKRDQYLSGFFYAVRGESYFPYEGKAKETLDALNDIVDKYRGDIRRLPLNEETAKIEFMLTDIEKLDMQSLQESGLHRWLQKIEEVNEAFKQANEGYITDAAVADTQESASDLAPSVISALEGIYSMFYALMQVAPSPELTQSYAELRILTNSYK